MDTKLRSSMKFIRVNDISLIGAQLKPLPGLFTGYRCGAWTAHYNGSLWCLCTSGLLILSVCTLAACKSAAEEFNALQVDWRLPVSDLIKAVWSDKDVSKRCLEIRAKHII